MQKEELKFKVGDLVYVHNPNSPSNGLLGYVAVINPKYLQPIYIHSIVVEIIINNSFKSKSESSPWKRFGLDERKDRDFTDVLAWKSIASDSYTVQSANNVFKFDIDIKDLL